MNKNFVRLIIIISNIFFVFNLKLAILAIAMSPMIFDAPNSSSIPNILLLILILSYPILGILSLYSWKDFCMGKYKDAFRLSILHLPILIIFKIFLANS